MTRVVRALLLSAGLAVLGYGLAGLLTDPYVTDPLGVAVWAVGALLVHDGLWLPLVCALGAALARATAPRGTVRHSSVLRGWLAVAAALSAVGLPAVLRAGRDGGNPTVLPLPYLRNWLLVLATTALLALSVALLRRWRRAVRRRAPRAGRG
ncbi:hypothetical protein CFP65_0468 [Kitasatospora sp. MMS16-BH015]|uniref:hypothetical protein n=1 Tax=Kitasatospora sp. MMS16-BH015 TaxID=2018025 RepID=UPI000CA29FBE|nr:hypothetical protein [Kitasatospora sp. MMS16-BH015]AUG75431.1 hypothetical protein CFP65_0468 [Kitasatospora sp. MMS16-BH015]